MNNAESPGWIKAPTSLRKFSDIFRPSRHHRSPGIAECNALPDGSGAIELIAILPADSTIPVVIGTKRATLRKELHKPVQPFASWASGSTLNCTLN
jgi:hypothetical protein